MLKNEAIQRAYPGVEEPITVAGKREIIHQYSIPCGYFLLKGARPQK